METKALLNAELKITPSTDGTAGTLEGYASRFGGVDTYGDTVDPGAYAELLPEFIRDGFLAVDHSWSDRIGTIREAREDSAGLYFVADYHSTPMAQEARLRARERIDRGKSVQISIGYEAVAYEYRKVEEPVKLPWGEFTDRVRALTKIHLYEISDVAVAADSGAVATGAKNGPTATFGEVFDAYLRRLDQGDSFEDLVAELLAQEEGKAAAHGASLAPLARLVTHSQAQMAAVLAEAKALRDRRVKEGRTFSSANVATLEGHAAAAESIASGIRTLLTTAKRTEKTAGAGPTGDTAADTAAGAQLFLDFQRTLARLNGVPA